MGMNTAKFQHGGRDYEIRIICDGEAVYVKAFHANRPVNRFRYEATVDTVSDLSAVTGLDAVKHLIEIAKQDVVSGLK